MLRFTMLRFTTRDTRGRAVAAGLLLAGAPRLGAVRLGVVDGPSGSGKTTFAAKWASAVAAASGGTVLDPGDEARRPSRACASRC